MDEIKNSVLGKMTTPGLVKENKKNIVISDLSRDTFELSKKIMRIFSDYETQIIFYSGKDNQFLNGDETIPNIEEVLTNAALVFNFISVKKQAGRDISRIIENLKITSIQNTLSTRMVFFAKNTIKSILETYEFKTPVFEFIGRKTAEESFADFTQPSRIFSAENHFFSGKLDTVEKIQSVYDQAGGKVINYFIEEYIEGDDIYSFIFKKEGQIIVYNTQKKGESYISLDENLNNEISKYSKTAFEKMGIEKFALFHIKKAEKRGIFVLNIFVD